MDPDLKQLPTGSLMRNRNLVWRKYSYVSILNCMAAHSQAAKVICSAKISSPGANGDPAPAVNQADFCPTDASVICVTGDKIIRFFRVADVQLKPLPLILKIELQVYTAHCWLDNDEARRSDALRFAPCVSAKL